MPNRDAYSLQPSLFVGIFNTVDGLKQRTVNKWLSGTQIMESGLESRIRADSLGNLRVDKLEFLARSRTYGAFMTTGYKFIFFTSE